MVGSGIAGCVSALEARRARYDVTLLSKSPDPRDRRHTGRYESSTLDGLNNRYGTSTEGHPYLDTDSGTYARAMYPDMGRDWQIPVSEGGWLAKPLSAWTQPLNQRWLRERHEANAAALADPLAAQARFNRYVVENRYSLERWFAEFERIALADQTLPRDKKVLPTISLQLGYDRFYDDANLFQGALAAQTAQGVVCASYPDTGALAHTEGFEIYRAGLARERPFIQGGAITAYGFTMDVQAFMTNYLLPELERLGARLLLGARYEVMKIERESAGVSALVTRGGERFAAKHVWMHPGAYIDPHVLQGTAAYGKLAGVKGYWMRIKDAGEFFGVDRPPRPNKIHGGKMTFDVHGRTYRSQVADLNVMPVVKSGGSWDLIVGSGYNFVGVYPFEGDQNLATDEPGGVSPEYLVKRAFIEVFARVYAPDLDVETVLAKKNVSIDFPSRGCIRSFTPDDQELREIEPTAQGGLLRISGGGNTGTTTKAWLTTTAELQHTRRIDERGLRETAEERMQYEAYRAACQPENDSPEKWQATFDRLQFLMAGDRQNSRAG